MSKDWCNYPTQLGDHRSCHEHFLEMIKLKKEWGSSLPEMLYCSVERIFWSCLCTNLNLICLLARSYYQHHELSESEGNSGSQQGCWISRRQKIKDLNYYNIGSLTVILQNWCDWRSNNLQMYSSCNRRAPI